MIKITMGPDLWQPAAQWIRECQQTDLLVQPDAFNSGEPFINPKAKPGIDQLLTKAKKLKASDSLTLSLNRHQAVALIDQFDSWGFEEFRLPTAFRNAMPRNGPTGFPRLISMQLEQALDQDDASSNRTARR